MTRIHVEFDLVLPENVTHKQIDEWLNYQLGFGVLDLKNPLADIELRDNQVRNLDWDER